MKVVLRATLAGGIAVGSTSSMFIQGGVSLIIGAFAGATSALTIIWMTNRIQLDSN
jgi:hypothetical protein